MIRKIALLLVVCTLPFAGCDKIPFLKKKAPSTPAPAVATPAPTASDSTTTEPSAPGEPKTSSSSSPSASHPSSSSHVAVDTKAEVVVLCYHRVEGKVGGALSIEPALFEKQMDEVAASDAKVISMQDFLAWRRYEKNIPAKSVLITIDDGYVSGYDVAWPILKKHGFPFTMFVYLDYIERGGKSITWTQLAEMRDAGVEIGSHTVSHWDLRGRLKKVPGDYDAWLKNEVDYSKRVIEDKLGIKCATIAYPYGLHNEKVNEAVKAAGYEAAFTTYGQRLGIATNFTTLGRYDVTTKDARGVDSFTVAMSFKGMQAPGGAPVMGQDAATSMVTEPMNNEVITNPTPTIKANLETMGTLDAGTVVMRVSGLGATAAKYDPATNMISYTVPTPLKPGSYTVIVAAKSAGRPVETRWAFSYSPDGVAPAEAAPLATPIPATSGAKKRKH